ncbi:MAG: 1-acyl-sn-glycerol-3-phosphate acyltransferase [Clostridia bacterium]|nr:1-acyl-sn-glycerol-3-phosphate acyltransferase [Clostridia bacterium]
MILEETRLQVIDNIKTAAESGEFHKKVEVNDPVLSREESKIITDSFTENRLKIGFKLKSLIACAIADIAMWVINKDTKIIGFEKIPKNLGGVIVTSNHFSPFENTIIRHLNRKMGRRKLNIICQDSNFAMSGPVGFLMNYANTIPITAEPRYLARDFLSILKEKLVIKGESVLLYPEQEMWFNYRKPRPPKGGAYFYAAKLNVPIISCFVEMIDTGIQYGKTGHFNKVRFKLYILDVLYSDKDKTTKENTEELAAADYKLKKECYERVYGKKLNYNFDPSDIAGYRYDK